MGVAQLRKYLIDLLSGREDKRQLSVLADEEVYVLSIMLTVADTVQQIDPDSALVLRTLVDNHLALRVSVKGAGRKDLKDLLTGREYHMIPTYMPQQSEEEGSEKKKRGLRSRIF